ncbi:MAG TPA: histidine kinase, partial [Verrucomicrobiae bacterium]
LVLGRYLILRKVRWQMMRLEMQNLLERERMRISRDIHDDLGARVTQISLVSAMASKSAQDPEQSRMNFNQITEMSRDLVAALYETVWAVNPENDNLNELGTYLFQMVNKLCERSACRCRFHIQDLPHEVVVPSQIRHNICMAVKEAVNNIKKHAGATELTVKMEYTGQVLTIAIADDGCGFELNDIAPGNGLNNLQSRLKEIGGICRIESRPGHGTMIHMRIEIKPVNPK